MSVCARHSLAALVNRRLPFVFNRAHSYLCDPQPRKSLLLGSRPFCGHGLTIALQIKRENIQAPHPVTVVFRVQALFPWRTAPSRLKEKRPLTKIMLTFSAVSESELWTFWLRRPFFVCQRFRDAYKNVKKYQRRREASVSSMRWSFPPSFDGTPTCTLPLLSPSKTWSFQQILSFVRSAWWTLMVFSSAEPR